MGGLAAHLGYLRLPYVVLVAAIGGFCGDQAFFWLGRLQGTSVLTRFPSVAARAAKLNTMIERYHEWVIVGVRFAYGFRIAGPILIGTSKVPALRFAIFNALGAALWAVLIAGLGWTFGVTIESLLGRMRHLEKWLFLGVVIVGAAFWLIRRQRASR
jgi:membrane protein DedA with SNARE-associated domain